MIVEMGTEKTVVLSLGEINLDIPIDRKGEFEPQAIKKNQTDISNIEDQVLSMYAKGMTTRDISTHLRDVYGVEASAEMISHMTDRILPIAKEWQNRPLERKYAIVFMDAIHFHVREDNQTIKKAVYVAIGIKLNGNKEVLGMWIGGNESAKYWLGVLKYSHAVAFLTAFTVFSHSSSIVKFLILLINVAIFFPIGFIQCSPTVSRPIMQSNAFKTGAAVQSTSCPSMAMIWQVFSNSSFPYHRAIISAATFGYA